MGDGRHIKATSCLEDRFYNKAPVWFLQFVGYNINTDTGKCVANHIALIIVSGGLCVLSCFTLGHIGFFVAIYQILCVFYKFLTSWFYAWNYYKKRVKQKTKGTVNPSFSTPYSHEATFMALLIIITGIAILVALLRGENITDDIARKIIVYICIVTNGVFDFYNGIKGLYLADV